jgi:hypothetical protein
LLASLGEDGFDVDVDVDESLVAFLSPELSDEAGAPESAPARSASRLRRRVPESVL